MRATTGLVFDLDTFAVHDGPGIRLAVYLKGCPLHCAWCHSPESQASRPEPAFLRDRCLVCGGCVAACPEGAQELAEGRRGLRRPGCLACGRCVAVCPTGALQMRGFAIAADEVIARAVRLKPFFRHSGGGVTLTGGEVTSQPSFAEAILVGCQAEGIHTAIETCGACSWQRLSRLTRHADLILYDLKLIDPAEHERWTGQTNERILANARRLAGRTVEVRIPLVPGVTDTDQNLGGLFGFMASAGLRRATMLRFNPSAGAKYEWLGRSLPAFAPPPDPDRLRTLVGLAATFGIEASIA